MAVKNGLSVPQLLCATRDCGTAQHLEGVGHFPEPHIERTSPMLQPPPTDIREKFLATAVASQFPRHYHSTFSHSITQTQLDNNSGSLQGPIPIQAPYFRARDPPPLIASQYESTPRSSYSLVHQTRPPLTQCGCQLYPADNSLPPLEQGGLRRSLARSGDIGLHSKQISPPIMSQTATESAQRWRGIINVDMESGSRKAMEIRQKNSLASKKFRQRKKVQKEEMKKIIEKLTEERDHFRHLCHQLLEKEQGSRIIKHSASMPSFKPATS
ncbi:hypothetical protein AJ78_08616 [Emergomyces pasteurianus Ep9510]|uniref:BZIP domain-containing protein n=1 Tax=Emergomyces pasteurianus Ep9510 TaxID=1447872 RepID=A0A1J9Q236_9EURO|nr:hypothetical protein AJ78_08616 [Emergomyces pasteurianus Ep9510]